MDENKRRPILLSVGLFLAGLLILAPAAPTAATARQETIVVPDEPSCPECRIEFDLVVSIGDPTDQDVPWLCPEESWLTIDSHRRFYASGCSGQTIYVFASDGELLSQIGGPGQGPGEFQGIQRIWVDPLDNLHVFESRRHTVISPEREVTSARTIPTYARDIVFRPDGSTVQQLVSNSPALVGIPNHIVTSNGRIVRSFGVTDETYRYDTPSSASFRALAPADGDAVWSMHHVKYDIELWEPDANELVRVLTRDAEWFRTLKTDREGYLRALRRDSQGYLWTLAVMPDPAYEGTSPFGRPETAPAVALPRNWWRLRWDTWIEVIDPRAGTVVARTKRDVVNTKWLGNGLTYSYTESDDGGITLDVWSVRLVRPNQPEGGVSQ